jgi:penicillin-binding protein 2
MYIERRKLRPEDIKRVSLAANIIVVFIFIVLFFVFWNAQVLKNQHYKFLALQNIAREVETEAPRGFIKDCRGSIIAENRLEFTLFLIREEIKDLDKTLELAAKITNLNRSDIQQKIEKFKGYPASHMIPLKKDLSLDKVIYIKSRSDRFPEFEIHVGPTRAYSFGQNASHILGYISEITTDELQIRLDEGYRLGDMIGKSGLEREYEDYLRGTPGIRLVIKDNLGSVQKVLKEVKPVVGHSVVLTIDMELQNFVEEIFKDHNGTIGVVDLTSGGFLALVSKPNYNPALFSGAVDSKEWQALINDPRKPMQNKFIQGLYSPGSVFKIVMALAGLQEGVIQTSTTATCSGSVKIYDRVFHCWVAGGHGRMNLINGIKNSCNVYFYHLGKKLDIDVIARYARVLGLGKNMGIDLPNENPGRVPTRAWKQEHFKQQWFPGETISVAIGGGMLSVTPAQVLLMISTVALRGRMPQLHLLKKIEVEGGVYREFQPSFKRLPIEPRHVETVVEGLYRVVNDGGTGRAARMDGVAVCGKTGTQQIISKENPNYDQLVKQRRFRPHSWFVSFAPRYNPRYAMVVLVEHGGDAGEIAAPLAVRIYRKLFQK